VHQLLTVDEAALRVGVSPQALRERIRRGSLRSSKAIRDGRSVSLVSSDDLAALYPETRKARKAAKGSARPFDLVHALPAAPSREGAELELVSLERDEARAEAAQLREELVRVRGELVVSAKVEEYAQRAADKLEAKLEAVRRELEAKLEHERRDKLSLALELGKYRGQLDRLDAQLERGKGRGFLARLLGR
jgi:hypothetical protein